MSPLQEPFAIQPWEQLPKELQGELEMIASIPVRSSADSGQVDIPLTLAFSNNLSEFLSSAGELRVTKGLQSRTRVRRLTIGPLNLLSGLDRVILAPVAWPVEHGREFGYWRSGGRVGTRVSPASSQVLLVPRERGSKGPPGGVLSCRELVWIGFENVTGEFGVVWQGPLALLFAPSGLGSVRLTSESISRTLSATDFLLAVGMDVRLTFKKTHPGSAGYTICFTPFQGVPIHFSQEFHEFLRLEEGHVRLFPKEGQALLARTSYRFSQKDELELGGPLQIGWREDAGLSIRGRVSSFVVNGEEVIQTRWDYLPDEIKGGVVGAVLASLLTLILTMILRSELKEH